MRLKTMKNSSPKGMKMATSHDVKVAHLRLKRHHIVGKQTYNQLYHRQYIVNNSEYQSIDMEYTYLTNESESYSVEYRDIGIKICLQE